MDLFAAIATTVCSCDSGLSIVFEAAGSLRLTPCCSMGATSIMMMSSTSMTSTSGVTLMSALTPPLAPPTSIDMDYRSPLTASSPAERPWSDPSYAVFLMK